MSDLQKSFGGRVPIWNGPLFDRMRKPLSLKVGTISVVTAKSLGSSYYRVNHIDRLPEAASQMKAPHTSCLVVVMAPPDRGAVITLAPRQSVVFGDCELKE